MMELLFHVTKQNISRKDDNVVVSNSVKYLKAKFDFETDWNVSNNICPIFRKGGEFAGYLPEFVNGKFLDEQKSCYVPIEVLNTEGRFFVSIFDFTNGQRITTNEVEVEVTRSGPVLNSPTIYSLDLMLKNENLQLTANGEAVGNGVTLPKQEIDTAMSDTSVNPVQNKVAKAYTDEKTRATPTDISLTDNLLQLTANGKAVGAGVTLPSGLRLINSITVADGETATMMKISKDVDGANFSLHNIMFAARLNLPSAQNVTIRLRTNDGGRYLVFKTGVQASGVLFVSGESKVFSIGTNTNAEYISANADLIGTTTGTAVQTFASNSISKTNISDVEIFLYDASNNFVQLQPGTTLEVWGC